LKRRTEKKKDSETNIMKHETREERREGREILATNTPHKLNEREPTKK